MGSSVTTMPLVGEEVGSRVSHVEGEQSARTVFANVDVDVPSALQYMSVVEVFHSASTSRRLASSTFHKLLSRFHPTVVSPVSQPLRRSTRAATPREKLLGGPSVADGRSPWRGLHPSYASPPPTTSLLLLPIPHLPPPLPPSLRRHQLVVAITT